MTCMSACTFTASINTHVQGVSTSQAKQAATVMRSTINLLLFMKTNTTMMTATTTTTTTLTPAAMPEMSGVFTTDWAVPA